MRRKARHDKGSEITKRLNEVYGPSEKTLLMIQMARDLGYDSYWAGDKAIFGSSMDDSTYDLIENLVELGWKRNLDD